MEGVAGEVEDQDKGTNLLGPGEVHPAYNGAPRTQLLRVGAEEQADGGCGAYESAPLPARDGARLLRQAAAHPGEAVSAEVVIVLS